MNKPISLGKSTEEMCRAFELGALSELPDFSHIALALSRRIHECWQTETSDIAKAVSVSQRDFQKLSNYPLHRRKRSVSAKHDCEVEQGACLGQAFLDLLELCRVDLLRDAEVCGTGRIYGPPKVHLRTEPIGQHAFVELEYTFYEILPRE